MTVTRISLSDLDDPRSDAFCLFYDAKTKTVKALNGSGRSPKALTVEHVRQQGVVGNKVPATNLNSVTVPGMRYNLPCCSILIGNGDRCCCCLG